MSEDGRAAQTEAIATGNNEKTDDQDGGGSSDPASVFPSVGGDGMQLQGEIELTRSDQVKALNTPDKGRGVFARQDIQPDTLIEVSPVLLVKAHDYANNNLTQTIFDSYLFTWSRAPSPLQSDYALALGIGSLFNHSATAPNVRYTLDKVNQCIRYTTSKPIKQDEELCIFYGHGVRFGDQGQLLVERPSEGVLEDEPDILTVFEGFEEEEVQYGDDEDKQRSSQVVPTYEVDSAELIPEEHLPFSLITSIVAPEDIPLETIDVYTISFDPRQSPQFFKFLQKQGFQQLESIRYLRRVRKIPEGLAEAIICPVTDIASEDLIEALALETELLGDSRFMSPSIVKVPASPARTISKGKEWSQSHWPVTVVPVKADLTAKTRAQTFTRGKVRWFQEMCTKAIEAAEQAKMEEGELPIVCIAAESWDGTVHSSVIERKKPIVLATHCDSRQSSKNPFGHAAMNLIAHVADLDRKGLRPSMPSNDARYLLTGLTVFMTHEPCLLCSMALLHSRISTLVYIRSSPGAGGCGSEYSLHEQKGTNHKYEVWKVQPDGEWSDLFKQVAQVEVDP